METGANAGGLCRLYDHHHDIDNYRDERNLTRVLEPFDQARLLRLVVLLTGF